MPDVTLTFVLERGIDPDIYSARVALACALHGALKEGESIITDNVEQQYRGHEHFAPIGKSVMKMPRIWTVKRRNAANSH